MKVPKNITTRGVALRALGLAVLAVVALAGALDGLSQSAAMLVIVAVVVIVIPDAIEHIEWGPFGNDESE